MAGKVLRRTISKFLEERRGFLTAFEMTFQVDGYEEEEAAI